MDEARDRTPAHSLPREAVDIDEAVDFFASYLDAEYAERLAVLFEPDDVLRSRREISESFMHELPGTSMRSVLGRAPTSAEELARIARSAARSVQRAHRVLFLVEEYDNPSFGQLFAGYVSGATPSRIGSFGLLLYATVINGRLKIIGDRAKDYDASEWTHGQGAEIGTPGTPRRVRPLVEPEHPDHRRYRATVRDGAP
ncbi:hypothetical protein HTZ77_27135 [Nonomuraea sp. SMC257]|uniref:Uncharacterized protein n=1 Tax=Nonomuraea montanisoli TaxID=2741721 RepID=A0A7Y6IBA6_9ACTN|nr:hypothetical protein [Nonomuraea montanisoli]NUW35077.1 hypothetical protein [Nonomuraea montanisoli]